MMRLAHAKDNNEITSGGFYQTRTGLPTINTRFVSSDLSDVLTHTVRTRSGGVHSQTTAASSAEIYIDSLRSKKYNLNKPLKIVITNIDDDEYLAREPKTGLAISGDTPTEALQSMKIELIEIFELYKSGSDLGPEPKRQLRILETYIGKKGGK